mmetsp:Transcript_13252/g.26920  ORF Transcript_13252/g.26920 Transcript_13252/m.26920 type:complete len:205 (-) Transcript_13252:191-805(-)
MHLRDPSICTDIALLAQITEEKFDKEAESLYGRSTRPSTVGPKLLCDFDLNPWTRRTWTLWFAGTQCLVAMLIFPLQLIIWLLCVIAWLVRPMYCIGDVRNPIACAVPRWRLSCQCLQTDLISVRLQALHRILSWCCTPIPCRCIPPFDFVGKGDGKAFVGGPVSPSRDDLIPRHCSYLLREEVTIPPTNGSKSVQRDAALCMM